MTWSAPERPEPDPVPDERAVLTQFLDWHRATLLHKCSGLTAEQLATQAVPPSSLSLLGLVRHLADVERHWWRRVVSGEDADPLYWGRGAEADADFDRVDPAAAQADRVAWEAEVAHGRAVAASLPLDALAARPDHGRAVSVRWVLVHLVEEYARHNGHADLLRECLDGVTGE